MENSWSLIILGLSVTILPLLLIVILADKFSDQSVRATLTKINRVTSESEGNYTSMSHISPKLKPRLVILVLCIVSLLFFGLKGNGKVNYYGMNFEAGSVFSPESYTSYGLFEDAENEVNRLVARKRNPSLMGVLVSSTIGGIVCYSLWKEDEFKELLIKLRNA